MLVDDDRVAAGGDGGVGGLRVHRFDLCAAPAPPACEALRRQPHEGGAPAPAAGTLAGDRREMQDRGVELELLADGPRPGNHALAASRIAAGGAQGGRAGCGQYLQRELIVVGRDQLLDLGGETAGDDQGPPAEPRGLERAVEGSAARTA